MNVSGCDADTAVPSRRPVTLPEGHRHWRDMEGREGTWRDVDGGSPEGRGGMVGDAVGSLRSALSPGSVARRARLAVRLRAALGGAAGRRNPHCLFGWLVPGLGRPGLSWRLR